MDDLDFKNRQIIVDHQLSLNEKKQLAISTTKTKSSNRKIPMTIEVYRHLNNILSYRNAKNERMIDGKCGFIEVTSRGNPVSQRTWHHRIKDIQDAFNRSNPDCQIVLSAHVLRHTFCSRMASKKMNPKILQYLVGHSDISMTLNVYTHVEEKNVEREVRAMANEQDNSELPIYAALL